MVEEGVVDPCIAVPESEESEVLEVEVWEGRWLGAGGGGGARAAIAVVVECAGLESGCDGLEEVEDVGCVVVPS